MKKILKRTLATFLVVLMLLTSAPLQGFVELEWPELSLPSVGQWFSGKASAADEKLTAEEAVDIFMANKSVWFMSEFESKYYNGSGCYFFIDLDFDGVLELVTSSQSGSGYYSVSSFYKINLTTKSIYEVSTDYNEYNGLDLSFFETKLYRKKSTGDLFYACNNLTRNGSYENGTTDNMFKYNGYKVVDYTLFFVKNVRISDTYNYATHYWIEYDSSREVSKSEYEKIRDNFYSLYTNLNLVKKDVDAKKFVSASKSTQRSLLLESYKAFDYDGRGELKIENECEVYLGDSGEGYINDSNSIYASYKGDIKGFDSSKVKFTVADSSVAEIKDITTLDLMQDHIDIYAEVISKKVGETTVTVSYNDASVTGKLTVKQPNEFKFEIEEPNLKYFEVDGVFFDDSNYLSKDGISLKMKYSNVFIDELNYEINDPEILKQLKYKNAKIVFEIEEGAGLSFENVDTVTKKEILLEDFDFLTEIEDSLNIFCTDSDALAMSDAVNAKIKCSVMLLENGEYVEKISEYIGFEVQSYKMFYIKEHGDAMKVGADFREMYDNSFAAQMMGLEDTKDFKFVQFLNDGLIKSIADACGTLDEQQAYQLMVADLVSIMSGKEITQSNEIFGSVLLNRCSDILDVLVTMIDEQGFGGTKMREFTTLLCPEAILNHITGLKQNGQIDELLEIALNDKVYKSRLARALGKTEEIGKICKVGGLGLSAASDIYDVVKAYSKFETVMEMLDDQTYILEDIKDSAENYGDEALANALESYINYENNIIIDDIILGCVNSIADETVDGMVSFAGDFFAKLVKDKIKNFTAEKALMVTGSVVSGVLSGIELGGFVSDLLCNNNDYGAACLKIVLAGHISQSLHDVIFNYFTNMAQSLRVSLDLSFEYAQKLDFAMKAFHELELMVCDSTIAGLEARATSAIIQLFCKNKGKEYREVISDVRVRKTKLGQFICHDTDLANLYAEIMGSSKTEIDKMAAELDDGFAYYKTLCVQCPVDVFVRNSKGEIVASVENNTVTKETGGIDIIVIEDEKFICLPSTEEYDIEVIATDEGTMDYTVFEYGSDSLSNIRSVSYEKIPLVKNKEFTAKLDTAKYTDKNNYNLSVGTETITATKDDYVPVTSVSFDGDADTVYAGSEITFSVVTDPENASPASFIWKSSDESVAAVSGGVVRGVKAGNAVITCELKSDSSIKASFEVTVTECNHSYSAWETVEESTCSEYGCKKRVCSVCNAVETEKITELKPHEAESESYDLPASCEKNAATVTLCKNCGEICQRAEKQGTATGHKLSAVTIDKKATTENSGSQSQKCSTCGERVNVTKIPRVIKPYLSQTSFVFDGKIKNPALMIYDYDGNKLAVNTDYRLTVDSGRVKPGTYKAVVSFIGKYEGTEKLSFTIAMKKTTVKATQNTTAIRLDWSAVPGAAGYRVFYKTAAGWKALCTTNKLTATFDKLPSGTKYTFAVMAGAIVDGKVIWADNYTVIETATQTLAPKKIAAAQNANAIRLTWSKCPGATGYRIFYKSGNSWKICLNATTATSHTFTNLKAGTKFTFAVRPYIITDSGVIWSDYTTYTASTLPAIPKTAVTSPSSGKITVKWNAVSGAEAYQLYYKTGNGGYKLYKNYFSVQTVSFSGLKSGTKYTFAVRAAKNTSSGWVFGSFTPVSVTVK